jgi:uncharacterized protein YjbI with pentapeptide repeats
MGTNFAKFVKWLGISEKSGWDIITDLSIPLAIFVGGTAFTYVTNAQSQRNSQEVLKDSILSGYLESMQKIFLDGEDAPKGNPSDNKDAILARALTLTVLNRLSSPQDEEEAYGANKRKAAIVKFLWEFGLIEGSSPVISLREANLRGVDLKGAILSRGFLCGARVDKSTIKFNSANCKKADTGINFNHADLRNASLGSSDLGKADFSGANLSGADLSRSILSDANFKLAKLIKANLRGASLNKANLYSSDLLDAKLEDAFMEEANLEYANLNGTTRSNEMPEEAREYWRRNYSNQY